MAKLEELTALLVGEIEDFKTHVEKLEKVNAQLKNTKIQMDLMEYKVITQTHQEKMETFLIIIERFEHRFDTKVKNLKVYVTIIVILLVSIFIVFAYLQGNTVSN